MTSDAHPITEFSDNFALGYPHTNSFTHGGKAFLLGQRTATETSLWKFDAASMAHQRLCNFTRETQHEKLLYSDTAFDTSTSVTIADNALWVLPKDSSGTPTLVYQAPEGHSICSIPAIRKDGKKHLVGINKDGIYTALLIDASTGESTVLFTKNWWANHFQFCPHDPSWIGFSHEGKTSTIPDRVWAWHATEAPGGKCVFDQMYFTPGKELFAGHERWSYHDRSVLIVAYGEGPSKPRGIYEAFTDGRPQKLISEGDRDSHLDVSRDGRWVVVDTTGPHDLPGKGWENAWPITDILVIDRATGERRFVVRVRQDRHPSHAHPVFSPDGTYILFNDCDETGQLNRVWKASNPFLA